MVARWAASEDGRAVCVAAAAAGGGDAERNGWQVPKMNNQRYNQMLKAIGMVIGIENLHSHMGRHTLRRIC